jgi:hypothetical protein
MAERRVTIRLTESESNHCDKASKGNLSYYIRELIQRDMNGTRVVRQETNSYIPPNPINEYMSETRHVVVDSDNIKNDIAKDTIRDLFNF